MVQKKILIVDDSKGWLDYHVSALTQIYDDEFTLEVANSGRRGYDMVYNNIDLPYSLIISDLQMECDFEPKFAGEWFIERVKELEQYKMTPIIIMSAAYNIRIIAENLNVNCLSKAIAARDLTSYKLALEELIR